MRIVVVMKKIIVAMMTVRTINLLKIVGMTTIVKRNC